MEINLYQVIFYLFIYFVSHSTGSQLNKSELQRELIFIRVCKEKIAFQPSFRGRQGYTLLPVEGYSAFSDIPSPHRTGCLLHKLCWEAKRKNGNMRSGWSSRNMVGCRWGKFYMKMINYVDHVSVWWLCRRRVRPVIWINVWCYNLFLSSEIYRIDSLNV